MNISEGTQSAIGYGVGAGGVALAYAEPVLETMTTSSQYITLIGGALIILLRVTYDALRLYKEWEKK